MVRVVLPYHLRNFAKTGSEVSIEVSSPVTIASVMEALESTYPVLRGMVREHGSLKRRAFVRFFACGQDVSFLDVDEPLPAGIVDGTDPFMIVGAVAGG